MPENQTPVEVICSGKDDCDCHYLTKHNILHLENNLCSNPCIRGRPTCKPIDKDKSET